MNRIFVPSLIDPPMYIKLSLTDQSNGLRCLLYVAVV